LQAAGLEPAGEGENGPDGFDQTKGPRALKQPVDRREDTGGGEPENEDGALGFERVAEDHRGDGHEAKYCELGVGHFVAGLAYGIGIGEVL
jgi:hypothetical protein